MKIGKEEAKLNTPRSGFLNLLTIGILDRIILCCGELSCTLFKMFSRVSGLYSPDASSNPPPQL